VPSRRRRAPRHPRHRALDDVGAGALDRRVDRRALGALALVRDLGVDPREPGLAPEQRLRIAALAHALERVDDVALDAGKALEVLVDDRLRLVGLDPEPPPSPSG
jgi:hypothetical protein